MSPRRLPLVGEPRSDGDELPLERPRCPERAVAVLPARDGISADAFRDAVASAARDAEVALVVGGADLVRRCKPWLVVVISAGLPRAAWTGLARAVQDEVDVVLAEPRVAVARACVPVPGAA